jgi:hypothetical protein
MRALKTKNPEKLVFIYMVYIRPILEFPSVVFNSDDPGKTLLLEKVQKKITKHIIERSRSGREEILPKYEDRIKILKLESLKDRRQYLDLRMF